VFYSAIEKTDSETAHGALQGKCSTVDLVQQKMAEIQKNKSGGIIKMGIRL